MKVLSVDDNSDNLDLVHDMLEEVCEVMDATSGAEAIKLAKEEHPDLILLDVQMPEMNGFETLEVLIADEQTKDIPVIFLSARYRDPDRIAKGLELGAFDYLTKPVDEEILIAKVRVVQRIKHAEDEIIKHQAALEKANLRLEKADRMKSDFLAMMSHEIRTPLNAILGFADLMAQSEIDETQHEHLQIINRSGKNLLDLINNILDYSKIESHGIELESTPFNLEHTVLEALELVLVKANEKKIELKFNIEDPSNGFYLGDPHRLRQVLLNLVNNAIKFTGQGEVQVNIESKETADNLWTVAFAVKDTGIGIPKENFDRLFIPFSQVDTSTTRRFGGTGLGLVICKRLIEIMGGEIWVESEADIGSTFHFKVDLPGAGEKEAVSEYAMDNQVDHEFAENAPLSILVAEDEPANQKLIGEILARLGYTSDLAEDGLGVIDRLKEKAYNLILLDIQMQNMDGLEVARRIRDGQCGQEHSAIYLIAITAYASKNDREKCLDAGMNDYIAKPILIGQLKDSLARAYQTISAG